MSSTTSPWMRPALIGLAAVTTLTGVGLGVARTAPTAEAARPSSYKVTGIDTSHYNHAVKGGKETARIDWAKVAQTQSFAFLKATQRTTWKDKWFAADWRAVSATSMARAPYHFFDPRSTRDGVAQADHFIRTIRAAGYTGRRAGELPPVLDVEKVPRKGGGEMCPSTLRHSQVEAFLKRVKNEFGVTPIVYTRASFVKECMRNDGKLFAGYPLWLARYGSGANEPQTVPGAPQQWRFWQYTETHRVPGIVTKVDHNVFSGSLSQLRAMAGQGGGSQPPRPTPRPEPRLEMPADGWPTVRAGQSGADVRTVQLLLDARGHRVDADRAFGPATAGAVKAFQGANGLTADGVVGPRTWAALVVTVRTGDRGSAVTAVQRGLAARGHRVDVDGAFGPGTAGAVKAFQGANGLTADGVVGPRTWRALVSAPGR
ncbi:GH25 family lysozyme [Streptomyces sp. NPDC000410]|uniref:GH25 family lysozyme n=1 Tax=Streptomyces sp. NPDC000410 TaxID=3154254 RepID=UPI003323C13B